jgi:hypothetical protein
VFADCATKEPDRGNNKRKMKFQHIKSVEVYRLVESMRQPILKITIDINGVVKEDTRTRGLLDLGRLIEFERSAFAER